MHTLGWPLMALGSWCAAWLSAMLLAQWRAPLWSALAVGAAVGLGLATLQSARWRRLTVALGFPVSAAALWGGAAGGWIWLLAGAVLAAAYPRKAWQDAPLYPTPTGALDALPSVLPLPNRVRVLDAGCGVGHGLQAWHRAYPQARLSGIEWSWLWALLARWRCPWAQVRQGDMWAEPWGDQDVVYLFQRPESMRRAVARAREQMHADAWLVSLAFEIPQAAAYAVLKGATPRADVYVYRVGTLSGLDVVGRD